MYVTQAQCGTVLTEKNIQVHVKTNKKKHFSKAGLRFLNISMVGLVSIPHLP